MTIQSIFNWLRPSTSKTCGCTAEDGKILQQQTGAIEKQASIFAIMALQAKYFELIDLMENKDSARPTATELVDQLFSEEATWTKKENDGEDTHFSGEDGMLKFAQWLESIGSEGLYIKHVGLNPQIDIIGDTATSKESLLVFFSDRNSNINTLAIAEYDDVLVKNAQGHWRFKSRTLRLNDMTKWPVICSQIEKPS